MEILIPFLKKSVVIKKKGTDQHKIKQELDLENRMKRIEVFPGNLYEFERLKGKNYTIIDVQGQTKYISGGVTDYEELGEPYLLLFFWPSRYRTILRKAVELGAEAIVEHKQDNPGTIFLYETGIPVKRSLA